MAKQLAKGTNQFREVELIEPVETVAREGWVKWGKDNLYPQFLVSLFYNSPIQGGVINSKVTYITSGGLVYDGVENWDDINKNGRSKYTLDELSEMYAFDQELSNGYYIKCKFDKLNDTWQLEHLPFELMRTNEAGNIFYYSENWGTNNQNDKTKFKSYTSFFNRTSETTECVLYVHMKAKQYRLEGKALTCGHYPIPSYSGGIDAILTDIEINYFRYSEVVNGYKGGSVLSLNNGIPQTTDEQNGIIDSLKLNATDKRKQGGIAVTFSDGTDRAPSILQMNGNDLDKRYLSTETNLMQKIMISHSVINPKLFGVMQTTSMFDASLQEDFQLFNSTYARFRQKNISESLTYVLQTLNGITGVITFAEYELFKPKVVLPIVAPANFSKEISTDEVLELFNSCGKSKDTVRILTSCEFSNTTDEDIIDNFLKQSFANIDQTQNTILNMLDSGESYDAIVKALDMKPIDVTKSIINLQKGGYLDGGKVTAKGMKEIVVKQNISVVYSYEKKPNIPDLVKGGKSRPFCETMLRNNKVFTRQEIDQISGIIGRDVWSFRGGWYHNPENDVNTPSCRHVWNQHIIFN